MTRETYLGGVVRNGKKGHGAENKTIVLGMLQRDGDIVTEIVPSVKKVDMLPVIEDTVGKSATIHTDELRTYNSLENLGYTHEKVSHAAGVYVRDGLHVNGVENFWSHLKGSVRDTHMQVSKKHLRKYAKEFEYRFNNRKNPSKMLPSLLSEFPKP